MTDNASKSAREQQQKSSISVPELPNFSSAIYICSESVDEAVNRMENEVASARDMACVTQLAHRVGCVLEFFDEGIKTQNLNGASLTS